MSRWMPPKMDARAARLRAWIAEVLLNVEWALHQDALHIDSLPSQRHPSLLTNQGQNGRLFSYASTQVDVDTAEEFLLFLLLQSHLDPTDIITLESEPHITVKYGLHDDSLGVRATPLRVAEAVANSGAVTARIGRLSLFSIPGEDRILPDGSMSRSGGQDVLKLDVVSPQLHALNRQLCLLPHTDTYPQYLPHLTVAYLREGTGQKYLGLPTPLSGRDLLFRSLTYSDTDAARVTIPLDHPQASADSSLLSSQTLLPNSRSNPAQRSVSLHYSQEPHRLVVFREFLTSGCVALLEERMGWAAFPGSASRTRREAEELANRLMAHTGQAVLGGYSRDSLSDGLQTVANQFFVEALSAEGVQTQVQTLQPPASVAAMPVIAAAAGIVSLPGWLDNRPPTLKMSPATIPAAIPVTGAGTSAAAGTSVVTAGSASAAGPGAVLLANYDGQPRDLEGRWRPVVSEPWARLTGQEQEQATQLVHQHLEFVRLNRAGRLPPARGSEWLLLRSRLQVILRKMSGTESNGSHLTNRPMH